MVRGEHVYLAIDLKSFYASVECHDRGLDPLRTHLVVADEERTDKTICLAVSPSLKAYGIPGRARLFEVRQRLASVNAERAMLAPGGRLSGESCDSQDLEHSPEIEGVDGDRQAANGALSGGERQGVRRVPAICRARAHPCLFDR